MLRKMKMSDSESLRELNATQLGYDVPLELTKRQMRKLLADTEKHFFLVCEDDLLGEVVGYVHAELYENIYSESMFNILALAVSKKLEKKGVGKSLMRGVEEEATLRNISMIRLNSGENRIEAHQFYEHIGYHSDKLQKRFLKSLNESKIRKGQA